MRVHFTLRSAFWLARSAAFVLVCTLTVSHHTDRDRQWFEVSILIAVAILLALWGWLDWRSVQERQSPIWLIPVTLGCLALAGGLGSALGTANAPVFFALIAVIGAGDEIDLGPACGVMAGGVVGIEISGVVFGFSTGTALGLPLLLLAGLLVGRNRREVRARSDQAAALVKQMELTQDEQRRVATLDERNRIAREIHDVLAHSLSALGIQIGAARAVLQDSGDIEATLRLLDGAQHLASNGIVDSRRAILALRADTPPLPESLASLVENHQLQHQAGLEFIIKGNVRPLQPDANLALIRTAHEALANAAKHASGGAVCVTLEYGSGRTMLTVSNDKPAGTSAQSAEANGGYGLAGMRERLLLIGGTLTAGSTELGWSVHAVVPQ